MAGKVYKIPVTGFLLVESNDASTADMAAQAHLCSSPHIETEAGIAIDLGYAEQYSLTESYAIDNCGMTIGEFFEDIEREDNDF